APQVRYTFDFGNGLTLAAAAENAQVKVENGASSSSNTQMGSFSSNPSNSPVNLSDKIPDFTFKLNYAAPWGHIDGRVAISDDWVVMSGGNKSTTGWAVGVAGSWNVPFFAGDTLNAAFQYGDGATKYVEGSGPQMDVVVDSALSLHKITAWQAQANYAHYWFNAGGANLRSNLAFSYLKTDFKQSWFGGNHFDQSASYSNQYKDGWFGAVNLIWSPVPQVDLGVEYAYGRVQLQSGQRADSSAVNAIATFRF
ncbi:MAG TPA: DcaP family trimeric outer membrane transporter, partial [Stellaceae bacterium]|nr:DcaP family trimeric outer membrane transporter [Stellaceae bacterium]